VGGDGFASVQADKAGWRYGFLASKEDGSRVYSPTFAKSEGTAEFTVPADTKFLWLVVMGAPTEHSIFTTGPRGGRGGARGRRGARGAETFGAAARGGEATAARGGEAAGGDAAARGGEGAIAQDAA